MSRTTFYQKNYVGWPPVPISEYANPNSKHWEDTARAYITHLLERMGLVDYEAWVDSLPDGLSWQQFAGTLKEKLAEVEQMACTQDTTNSPACDILPGVSDGKA